MNRLVATRRRAQGMTEYLVLLGLIALLLVAAVRHFALAVDEAIEGTILAWERHKDPNDSEYAGKPATKPIGYTKPKNDKDIPKPVYLVSIKIDGTNPAKHKWQRSLNKAGTDPYTGGVISGDAAERLGATVD